MKMTDPSEVVAFDVVGGDFNVDNMSPGMLLFYCATSTTILLTFYINIPFNLFHSTIGYYLLGICGPILKRINYVKISCMHVLLGSGPSRHKP